MANDQDEMGGGGAGVSGLCRCGIPEWVMTDHERLSATVWVMSLGALALIFVFVWRWSGTALSPAVDMCQPNVIYDEA